jgi:flagellar protein FliS
MRCDGATVGEPSHLRTIDGARFVIPASRAAQAYRRVESESRSPLELVVMLYDGALRFVNDAREAHARRDLRARGRAISKTLAIIGELQNTLDMERGGMVAEQLDNLYTYISSRLLDVTLQQDIAACDEVHKLLSTLRDGWAQAATQPPATELAMAR